MEESGAPLVTSLKNPLILKLVKLRKKRWRDDLAEFVIEGHREILRALAHDVEISLILSCPDLHVVGKRSDLILQQVREKGISIQELGRNAFVKASYRDTPEGIIALATPMALQLEDIGLGDIGLGDIGVEDKAPGHPALIVVVESIEKPGNLGAILRSCDGAGVDGVIVCDGVTDIYNPNVVRSSLGTLFTQPVVQAGALETVSWLRENEITILSTTPDANVAFTDVDMTGNIALVLGAEDTGLGDLWLQETDQRISIPMLGDADSLNVAMAATLVIYEAMRQRAG